MENQSLNQVSNEQTNLNSEKSMPMSVPVPVPLQVIMQNYQSMIDTMNSPANQTGVVQANVVNRVGTLYKIIPQFLLPIIYGLLDFMKAFISKIGEQDRKIAMQQENLNVQDHNLRVMGDLLDAVKADLKNTKIKFDSSMKTYHENLDRLTNEYHKNIDELARKLIKQEGQDIGKPMDQMASMMYQGGEKSRTKKHRKYRRKISK